MVEKQALLNVQKGSGLIIKSGRRSYINVKHPHFLIDWLILVCYSWVKWLFILHKSRLIKPNKCRLVEKRVGPVDYRPSIN